MDGRPELIIAGGALQLLGFVLVAWELWRVQRREFGTPESFARIRAWFRQLTRRVLRRRPETHLASASVSGGGTITASGRAWRNAPDDATIEQRVEVIEMNLLGLNREVSEQRRKHGGQIQQLRSGLDEVRGRVQQEQEQREADRRAFLRVSIALQTAGTGFFVVGTVLGVVGSLV